MAQERNQSTPRQTGLPFAEGEASHAERWNDLGIAMLRIGRHCRAEMSAFVRWVFNVTKGGTAGALTKSYAELAERPWGLCCDERTARRTVELACRFGLVSMNAQRRWDGSQQCNTYTIDWAGVAALKRGRTGGQFDHPPGHSDHLGGQNDQGGGQNVRHIRNDDLTQSSVRKNSGPVPGAEPNPRKDLEETDADAAVRAAAGSLASLGGDEERGLSALLCRQSPLLAEARERRIAPLPAGDLLHGVYAAIDSRHLRRPLSLVAWHRKQLTTLMPVMGGTEADLLLVIAAGLFAVSVPHADVRKNRVALFVSVIARRKWCKALPFVPKARKLLDEAIAYYGPGWMDRVGELPSENPEIAASGGASAAPPLPPGSGREMLRAGMALTEKAAN